MILHRRCFRREALHLPEPLVVAWKALSPMFCVFPFSDCPMALGTGDYELALLNLHAWLL